MTPATSRAAIAITAIIALAVIVGLAIFHRDSGFEVVIDGEGGVSLSFEDNKVDFAELLDRVLAAEADGSLQKEAAEAILENRDYYHITSTRLVDALRNLPDDAADQPFTQAWRDLLYDLKGPFARPYTFAGADDAGLLGALTDLDPELVDQKSRTTNGSGKTEELPVSPLLSALWVSFLNGAEVFRVREIHATIVPKESIASGSAKACLNSLLDKKHVTIVTGGVMKSAYVYADAFCPGRRLSAQELLAGQREKLFMAPADVAALAGDARAASASGGETMPLDVRVVVAPKFFGAFEPTFSVDG